MIVIIVYQKTKFYQKQILIVPLSGKAFILFQFHSSGHFDFGHSKVLQNHVNFAPETVFPIRELNFCDLLHQGLY